VKLWSAGNRLPHIPAVHSAIESAKVIADKRTRELIAELLSRQSGANQTRDRRSS